MKTRNTFSRIGALLDVFGSALAASRAVEASRRPAASDLRTLGIDPKAFRGIRF